MTLLNLHKNYNFHDSVLDRIEYADGELMLYIGFCDFMQESYNTSDDKNSDMIVTFHNAEYRLDGGFETDGAGFLTQSIEEDHIVFFMESSPEKCGSFIIKADSVDVVKTRTYNL